MILYLVYHICTRRGLVDENGDMGSSGWFSTMALVSGLILALAVEVRYLS